MHKRTILFQTGEDGAPEVHGWVGFGNVRFHGVTIRDDGFFHPEQRTTNDLRSLMDEYFVTIGGGYVHFDEPMLLDRDKRWAFMNCVLTAPPGCVVFDYEAARKGDGALQFGYPKRDGAK